MSISNTLSKRFFSIVVCFTFAFFLSASPLSAQDFNDVYQSYLDAFEREDFEAALPLAKQAVVLGEAKFGANHENTMNLRFSLGNTLMENRKYVEAYELFEELSDEFTELHGEVSVEVLEILLAQLLSADRASKRGDFFRRTFKLGREAVELSENLAALEPKLAVVYYYQVISILHKVSVSPMTKGRMISYVKEAEKLLIAAYGNQDARLVETRLYLSNLYLAANKKSAASEVLEKIVSTVEQAVDFTHPYELVAHARLVEVYESMGKSDQATEHCIAIGEMTPWDDTLIEPTPIYRIDPEYPINEARRGNEGWVKIKFDISEYGFVKNPEVIDNMGGKGFIKKSLKALERWRYAPKFVDGESQVAEGMFVQLDFTLSK